MYSALTMARAIHQSQSRCSASRGKCLPLTYNHRSLHSTDIAFATPPRVERRKKSSLDEQLLEGVARLLDVEHADSDIGHHCDTNRSRNSYMELVHAGRYRHLLVRAAAMEPGRRWKCFVAEQSTPSSLHLIRVLVSLLALPHALLRINHLPSSKMLSVLDDTKQILPLQRTLRRSGAEFCEDA